MMEFPGKDRISDPMLNLVYDVDLRAAPEEIWPWLKQVGYHRGGWYIDTWWDRFEQAYFWPLVVPKDARGTYQPSAEAILPEYQQLAVGHTIPDGPPGSAYYEVIDLHENRLLLLYATTHFKYMAPQFVYRTRLAPKGAFCWAFILEPLDAQSTRLTSWWQAEASPKSIFTIFMPLIVLIDSVHQREILKGIKRRVER